MADVVATFRRPFAEQVAAYRLRLGELVPTTAWDDIRHNAHDRAFMVAGATKADLLADLAQAVDKSIAEGRSLEEFRRDFRSIVEKNGWYNWTGEGTKAGEAWRTRVIYRTNAATTYSAGRLAQLREGGFKYYVYRHGGSAHPRLHHLAWDGLILPADHPFWDTHFPPNGWGCSCYVIGARSIEGAKRVGGDPSLELQPGWEQLDPKTSAPKGIGKGWDYSPGSSATDTILSLRDKLDTLPERPSIDLIQNWIAQGSFWDWFQSPNGIWPLLRLTPEDAKAIGSPRLVADLTAETAQKQLRAYPDLTAADYALAQQAVGRAALRAQDSPRSLIFVQDIPGESGTVLVVKAARRGEGIVVTDVRRMSRAEANRDQALAGLLGKGE
ncbi:phage minor head protein [Antarcticimicrobium sediminis]|uniref:Virion morphogenesis protein n=1 Tax=Antarcticimicrobium sediminis TaxID=2546227 RepID=A0A4R5F0K0_9RHOB|nr:phage minor head protein [Antarcticimicrobium sediminis]TDE40934.1 virion morphogenesis protein [Antarcticimicrobium sediminis]